MLKESARSKAIREWVVAKARSFWGIVMILGTLLVTATVYVAREVISDYIITPIKAFLDQIPTWAAQPIGLWGLGALAFLGLWFAFWVAVVLVLGWWETRPKPAKPAPVPPAISPYDHNAIQAARAMWLKVGHDAVGHPSMILEGISRQLPATTWLALLLSAPVGDLRRARDAVQASIHDKATVPLVEVVSRLETLFLMYMTAVRYMHACQDDHGTQLTEQPYGTRYKKWSELHPLFVQEMTALSLHSDYSALRSMIGDEYALKTRFERNSTPAGQ